MAKDSEENSVEKKKGGVGKFIFLILLLVIGAVVGGCFWKQYSTEKKADAFLEEAQSFIETRKFQRAEETISLADETLPGRLETEKVREALELEMKVDGLEKDLVVKLKEREWDASDALLLNLKELDSDNAKISQGEEEVRVGRVDDKRDALEAKLKEAEGNDDVEEVLKYAEELLALDTTHPNAKNWEATRVAMVKEISDRNAKAKVIHEQAIALDTGEYNEELLFLATEAKGLSSDKKYEEFYDKVNSYPREILFPADYATLQEAIDAAREIDTIQVAAGDYLSSGIINSKVKLVGVEGEATIFHCSGKESTVLYVGPKGELSAQHLMFKHSEMAGDEESSYSAVTVKGKADFTACLFYESSGHGIHVLDGGKVKMLSCRAEGNTWDGLAASGAGSEVSIDGCIFSKNKHNGIDVWDGASVLVSDSYSEKNNRSGVFCSKSGKLTLKGSTLTGNSHAGLYVIKDGSAKVEGSELSKNILGGGYGHGSGKVSLLDTKVLNNRVAGIVLAKGTSWELDTLTFDGNEDKEVWSDAEFDTLDDIKAVVEEVKEEAAAVDTGVEETPTAEAPEEKAEDAESPAEE